MVTNTFREFLIKQKVEELIEKTNPNSYNTSWWLDFKKELISIVGGD